MHFTMPNATSLGAIIAFDANILIVFLAKHTGLLHFATFGAHILHAQRTHHGVVFLYSFRASTTLDLGHFIFE